MFTLNNIEKSPSLDYYKVDSLPCPNCNDVLTLSLFPDEVFNYNQGGYAQNVLSRYDADVRERFISGMCGDCWSAMFADFDDE
jgi:hypothetical protein